MKLTNKLTKTMATKTTKKTKQPALLTATEASRVQGKLRTAIRSTTALVEKKNLEPETAKRLKKFRKMLQDANEWFGWNVSVLAQNKK